MRATMDGPATGQHDVKTGKKTGPPPRGDAILPHWGGREFFAAATACTLAARVAIRSVLADGIRSRQWGVDRASEAPRARIDGVGAPRVLSRPTPCRSSPEGNTNTVLARGD